MRDIDLYRHLLGLVAPWTVKRVALDVKEQRVDVWVEHEEGRKWSCPACERELPLYDHSEERSWRHLDSCQFLTFLHARPPRVDCPEHGARQVLLPWSDPRARFTALFERLAIDVLLEASVLAATRILRISWDEAWYLIERAVRRGRAAKPTRVHARLGVDEKSFAKRQRYATVVCDVEEGTVEYVEEGRRKASLDPYFRSLTSEQRRGIETVAMDMWEPYVQSVREHVPEGEGRIVYDRFHVMGHMSRAVDQVRRRENRELVTYGLELLKGTKFLWLYAEENVPEGQQARFEELKRMDLKTARAWGLKENLRRLWEHVTSAGAMGHWKRWFAWAIRSKLAPVIEVARMIERRLQGVITNFYAHPITNAVSEGLNSKIQRFKQLACGFRNFDHFRIAIFFHCGGLQLYPVTHGIPG